MTNIIGTLLNYDYLQQRAKDLLRIKATQAKNNADIEKIIEEIDLYQAELEVQNEDLINNQITLAASQNRYQELYQLSPVPYFTLNNEGIILDVNAAGTHLLGFSSQHLLRKLFSRYIMPEYQYIYSNHRQQLLCKENVKQICEVKLLKKNGPICYVKIESVSLLNSETNKLEILSCITDISCQSQAEVIIAHNPNKMVSNEISQARYQLLSSLIHNLNNPLAIISNYIYGCISRLKSGNFQEKQLIEALNSALQQSNRVTDIMLRLKNFNCQKKLNFETVCLDHLITETIPLIHYEGSHFSFNFIYHTSYKNLFVRVDKIYIQQVILQLVRNAIEAMRDNDILDPKIKIDVLKISNQQVEMSIIDNGPGITNDNKFKLFDPNFSTKPYGIGMGLAISKKIVEEHDGELYIENNIAGGACFKLTLPIAMPT